LPFCPRGGGGLGEGGGGGGLGEGGAMERIDGAARWKLKGRGRVMETEGTLANEFCDTWAINFNLPSPSS
jgi:hypothetical protein